MDSDRRHTIPRRLGIAVFFLATVNCVFVVLSHAAVNAQGVGRQDFGVAIASAYGSAAGLMICLIGSPVLVLAAAGAVFVDRRAARWLLAAAAVSALPFAILAMQGR
jgi:hypothetical protein